MPGKVCIDCGVVVDGDDRRIGYADDFGGTRPDDQLIPRAELSGIPQFVCGWCNGG